MSQHNLMNQGGSLIGGQQQQQEEIYEDPGFLLIEIRDSTAAELDIFNVLISTVPPVVGEEGSLFLKFSFLLS